MFKSLALRTKLFMVVGVPMLVLGGIAALAFLQAKTLADNAAEQVENVEQALAIEQLAATLRTELAATLDSNGTPESLEEARSATDSLWVSVFEFMNEADRAQLNLNQAELLRIREGFGEDPAAARELLSLEILGRAPEVSRTLWGTQAFQALITETVQLDRLQGDVYPDGETALDIVVLKNMALWEDALVAERSAFQLYLQPGIPDAVERAGLLGPNAAAAQAQDQFINLTPVRQQNLADRLAGNSAVLALDRVRVINRSGSTEARRSLQVSSATAGTDELLAAIAREHRILEQNVIASTNQIAADARAQQRNVLLGGVGLLVTVSLITLLLARSITRPLKSLTRRSREIASEDLPAAVALFRTHGADAEAPEIEPLVSASKDELGDLVGAFNELHSTAIELASQQAQSRRVAADMFVNLGRRNQKLLSRVLHEMDELERDEVDGERLSRLYSVDKMVTRMRRNAESLLVLAGTRTPRQWEEPADISDVIRAAMSEVEGFERVDIQVEDPLSIDGAAVSDVVHLLAELIENALSFSPPSARVRVGLRLTPIESLVYVVDEGLGLDSDALAEANHRILAAGHEEETPSKQLGLYVVGRLAARHGLTAGLVEETIGGGIVARVELGPVTLRNKRPKNAPVEPAAAAGIVPSLMSHGTMPIESAPDNDGQVMPATPALAISDSSMHGAVLANQSTADEVQTSEFPMPTLVPESLRAPAHREQETATMPIMSNAVPASAEVENFDPAPAPAVPDDYEAPGALGRRVPGTNLPDEMREPLVAVAADQFAAEFATIGTVEATPVEAVAFDAPLPHRHNSPQDAVPSQSIISPPQHAVPLQSVAPPQHAVPLQSVAPPQHAVPSQSMISPQQQPVVQPISAQPNPTPQHDSGIPAPQHQLAPRSEFELLQPQHQTAYQPQHQAVGAPPVAGPASLPARVPSLTTDPVMRTRSTDQTGPQRRVPGTNLPSSLTGRSSESVGHVSQEVADPQAIGTAFAGFQRSARPFDQAAFPDDDEIEAPTNESENS